MWINGGGTSGGCLPHSGCDAQGLQGSGCWQVSSHTAAGNCAAAPFLAGVQFGFCELKTSPEVAAGQPANYSDFSVFTGGWVGQLGQSLEACRFGAGWGQVSGRVVEPPSACRSMASQTVSCLQTAPQCLSSAVTSRRPAPSMALPPAAPPLPFRRLGSPRWRPPGSGRTGGCEPRPETAHITGSLLHRQACVRGVKWRTVYVEVWLFKSVLPFLNCVLCCLTQLTEDAPTRPLLHIHGFIKTKYRGGKPSGCPPAARC